VLRGVAGLGHRSIVPRAPAATPLPGSGQFPVCPLYVQVGR
jgi:hypothetical protein